MSVHPGGDLGVPPNPALYANPNLATMPSSFAAANNNNPMAMMSLNPALANLGLAPMGAENAEWGVFSGSGVDILNDLESVTVVKLYNAEEGITFIDQPRQFSIQNEGAKRIFSLVENEDTMPNHQKYRPFEVDAFDAAGTKAFSIIREESSACTYCCFCFACFGNGCKAKVKVKINDRIVGSINQDCSFNSPKFTIYRGEDYDGEELVKLEGSGACCTPAISFRLRYPKENAPSGMIRKKGAAFGGFTNTYKLNFPTMSSPELKALCIAAAVLFDFRFFPKPRRARRRRRR